MKELILELEKIINDLSHAYIRDSYDNELLEVYILENDTEDKIKKIIEKLKEQI